MKNVIMFLLVGLLVNSTLLSAKALIEPHVAYNVSASTSGQATTQTYTGIQYGAKFIYYQKLLGFNAGLDYTRSSYDLKTSGGMTQEGYVRNEYGGTIGYNFANLYRGWVTYYFSNKSELGSGTYHDGNTIELGFGYQLTPSVSLNGGYRMVTFTEVRSGTGSNVAQLSENLKFNEIVVGISFPYLL